MKKETNAAAGAGKEKSPLGVRIAKYMTALAVVLVLFWFGCTCQVREGESAVILRFGAVREEITEAGLYLKMPWPFESAVTYDNRMQYLESNLLETVTKDSRNVVIQSYVTWEIEDTVFYHNSVARGSIDSYIKAQVANATNSVMGTYDLANLVSLDKEQIKIDKIQEEIFVRVRDNCRANYGIAVTDVSILRLSLPDSTLESVFAQMRQDRQNEINQILEKAYFESEQTTNKADVEAEEIIKEGVTKASEIKAETEKAVAAIYNEAYTANIELYKFLKNLDTVVASINSSTVLVVKIDEYPFNVLLEYADLVTEDTVISDLNYILTKLNDTDRKALIDKIGELIAAAEKTGVQGLTPEG